MPGEKVECFLDWFTRACIGTSEASSGLKLAGWELKGSWYEAFNRFAGQGLNSAAHLFPVFFGKVVLCKR